MNTNKNPAQSGNFFSASRLKSISPWLTALGLIMMAAVSSAADTPHAESNQMGSLHIGTAITPEFYAAWNITVFRDGRGLPLGSGNAANGEKVFALRCARCHGPVGTQYNGGNRYRNYPLLWGGQGSLTANQPVQTIGSYWPYATSVFDYIRRAMPFWAPKTLSDDDIYALTAYLLYRNDIIEKATVIDKNILPDIKMPNRYGFIRPDPRPDTHTDRCINDCPPIHVPKGID